MEEYLFMYFQTLKKKYGHIFSSVFSRLKRLISLVARLEYRTFYYKLFLINKTVPTNFKLYNPLLSQKYPSYFRHTQLLLFKKHCFVTSNYLIHNKKLVLDGIHSLFSRFTFIEATAIKNHILDFKRKVDLKFYHKLQNNIRFFRLKKLKTNIFKFRDANPRDLHILVLLQENENQLQTISDSDIHSHLDPTLNTKTLVTDKFKDTKHKQLNISSTLNVSTHIPIPPSLPSPPHPKNSPLLDPSHISFISTTTCSVSHCLPILPFATMFSGPPPPLPPPSHSLTDSQITQFKNKYGVIPKNIHLKDNNIILDSNSDKLNLNLSQKSYPSELLIPTTISQDNLIETLDPNLNFQSAQTSNNYIYFNSGVHSNVSLNHEGFINKTNIIFSKEQLQILNKGPKNTFFSPLSKHDNLLFEAELEAIVRNLSSPDKPLYVDFDSIDAKQRISINNFVRDAKIKNKLPKDYNIKDHRILKSIKFTLENNNARITHADKANTLVAVYNTDYFSEMDIALKKNNFTLAPKLKHHTVHTTFKNFLAHLNGKGFFEPHVYNKIYPTDSTPCPIIGTCKTHKTLGGYRPIVSTSNSYISATSKWLQRILQKYNPSKFNVKNNIYFLRKLKQIKILPSYRIFSLDVESLYGSTDVQLSIDYIISRFRLDREKPFKITLADLHHLLNLCTSNIPCTFDNKIYCQLGGAAMGSPFSSLLSDIQLAILENKIMKISGIGTGINRAIIAIFHFEWIT